MTDKDKIAELERQVELLESVHWNARGVMRYNGIDKAKTVEYFNLMKAAVHAYTDHQNSCD